MFNEFESLSMVWASKRYILKYSYNKDGAFVTSNAWIFYFDNNSFFDQNHDHVTLEFSACTKEADSKWTYFRILSNHSRFVSSISP